MIFWENILIDFYLYRKLDNNSFFNKICRYSARSLVLGSTFYIGIAHCVLLLYLSPLPFKKMSYLLTLYCVKIVPIRNYSAPNALKYGPEKLRIQTLFRHCKGKNIHRTWLECVKTNYMRIKRISNGQTIQKIPNNREGPQQTFLLVKTCWRRIEILSVTKDKCFVISLNIGYVLHHCNAKGSLYICIEFWMRAPNRRQNLGNLLWLASVSNNNRNVIAATQNSRCYSSSRLLLLFLLF